MITNFKLYEQETYELSGKHSFFMFLQIISNHDFHFILNDQYTKLYKYHFFFSTETIKGIEEYVEIFKYKHSLSSAYKILLEIKNQKLAFFFGIKENSTIRYGFLDLDTKRSYVVGEFGATGAYFRNISKYKALQFINKILQYTDIKNLPLLSKIKYDLESFSKDGKIIINNNKIIKNVDRNVFTDEDFKLNRPYRMLDQWISKKTWKNKIEYSVNDDSDPIEFIIIAK